MSATWKSSKVYSPKQACFRTTQTNTLMIIMCRKKQNNESYVHTRTQAHPSTHIWKYLFQDNLEEGMKSITLREIWNNKCSCQNDVGDEIGCRPVLSRHVSSAQSRPVRDVYFCAVCMTTHLRCQLHASSRVWLRMQTCFVCLQIKLCSWKWIVAHAYPRSVTQHFSLQSMRFGNVSRYCKDSKSSYNIGAGSRRDTDLIPDSHVHAITKSLAHWTYKKCTVRKLACFYLEAHLYSYI